MVDLELTKENIEKAIKKLSEYSLREKIDHVQGEEGNEAHRILPSIWPVIHEIVLLADACEADLLKVQA